MRVGMVKIRFGLLTLYLNSSMDTLISILAEPTLIITPILVFTLEMNYRRFQNMGMLLEVGQHS